MVFTLSNVVDKCVWASPSFFHVQPEPGQSDEEQ